MTNENMTSEKEMGQTKLVANLEVQTRASFFMCLLTTQPTLEESLKQTKA